ncbi:MAG: phospholipase D-like domain-containing protein, partial [Gammaproteobacteria bacterium]
MNSAVSQVFSSGFASAGHAGRLLCIALLASVLGACAGLPPGSSFPKAPSSALPNPETTHLGSQFDAAAHSHSGNSGFRIISVGADGFLTRIEMINAAERTLDLQYYIFRSDDTGGLLTDAVLRAADRGVRVRVLIDDGETIAGDEQVLDIDAHPNIEVRMFNPFVYRGHVMLFRAIEFAFNASRLDYRMHNKLMVVDNSVALIGGRNIGDQYFQIDPDSQFADDDVFTGGPIVKQLSGTFDEYWKSPLAIPVAALSHKALPASALSEYRTQLDAQRRQMKSAGVDYVKRIASGEP